jgi:hypothetical protein
MIGTHPMPLATLIGYWLGELSAADEAALEEHFFGCEECTTQLEGLASLAAGVREAVRDGTIGMFVSTAFVDAMKAAGLRLREYRLEPGGSVNCTIGADDDAVVSRIMAPLAGVERLDIERIGSAGDVQSRVTDVPFDANSGEVVMIPPPRGLKAMSAFTLELRLIAVHASQERDVGRYTFNHAPS